jgi:signal peptidase I
MAGKQNEVMLSEYIKEHAEEEAKVIMADIVPPETAPYLEEGTELFDIGQTPEPREEIDRAFGGRPNVPKVNVIKAIHRDIGTKGYCIHISDRDYTGYTIHEVYRYVTNHDDTNHMTYIGEAFDCDDFAEVLCGSVNRILKGIPFGIIWYYGQYPNGTWWGHATNIGYCCRQDMMYLVEPQNDTFYRFNKKAWVPGMILI